MFAEQQADQGVDGGDADPATLGAAFDLQLRFLLDPSDVPLVAAVAQNACRSGSYGEELNRACWALALTTEVYRVGLIPGSPIAQLLNANQFTPEALLALTPAGALRQMDELRTLAGTQLRPHLNPPFALGPTFDGSNYCAADADLIAGGMLLDIKTRLGTKNPRTGVRSDSLPLSDVHQLLAYTFFDYSDRYKIDMVGIYSARYGSLITWNLAYVLNGLAGEQVDLARERALVWQLLGGP